MCVVIGHKMRASSTKSHMYSFWPNKSSGAVAFRVERDEI